MKLNPQEIRAAMDSRLSFLTANSARRARIRQAIRKGEQPRRKRTMSGIAAVASLVLVVAAGVALAAGLHWFGGSGNEDLRLSETASQPLPAKTFALAAGSDAQADAANAYITGTYFDGKTLRVAYTIENATWRESFTPTADELARMWKTEHSAAVILFDDAPDALLQQLNAAMENGTPFGLVSHTLWTDGRTYTGSGLQLGHADKTDGEINDDILQIFREYTALQLEDEALDLQIPLWWIPQYLYFDGTNLYTINGVPRDAGLMTATATRTDEPAPSGDTASAVEPTETIRLTGHGTYEGVSVAAVARVSAEHCEITLTAEIPGFATPDAAYWQRVMQGAVGITDPDPIGDYRYELYAQDAHGNILHRETATKLDGYNLSASFEGTGGLPNVMSVMLMLHNWQTGTEVMKPITLIREYGPPEEETISENLFDPAVAQYTVGAYITSISFDSSLLHIEYVMDRASRFAAFEPTQKQLKLMSKVVNQTTDSMEAMKYNEAVRQYLDAVENGEPGGVAIYTAIEEERTITDAGRNLGVPDSSRDKLVDGIAYTIREYKRPLMAAEVLSVEIPIQLNAVYLYFDGTNHYVYSPARETIGVMTATVERADTKRRHLTGTGDYFGVPVTVEATVTPANIEISLTAADAEFPEPDEAYWNTVMQRLDTKPGEAKLVGACWYELAVEDDHGYHALPASVTRMDAHTIRAVFYGINALPETLTVELLLASDNAAATLVAPVILTPDQGVQP